MSSATNAGYYTATAHISDAALAEKRAKWHEVPDVGYGYTNPLTHPDWHALWTECKAAGAVASGGDHALVDTCKGFWLIRRNKRGELSLEG